MSLPTVSDSDRVALDELIGQALLCDDIRSELLSQDTRKDALKNAELSLNLWLRIMSFGDAQQRLTDQLVKCNPVRIGNGWQ